MNQKAIITCALTGVLTDPNQHPVPVTPEQMASEAKQAFDAGATVMHVHFRNQQPGMGRLPSWEPQVASDVAQAIREACPGVIFNQSTGVVGPDISGPLACMQAIHPEVAACNAGSLNYLKATSAGKWAWQPMLFDNTVEKIAAFLAAMQESGTLPEFECFDVGIVRCVDMFVKTGMYPGALQLCHGRRIRHAGRSCAAADIGRVNSAGQRVAGHGDWPRQYLAAASARRRIGRPSAYRTGRYLLFARRRQGKLERAVDRSDGPLCAQRRTRSCQRT